MDKAPLTLVIVVLSAALSVIFISCDGLAGMERPPLVWEGMSAKPDVLEKRYVNQIRALEGRVVWGQLDNRDLVEIIARDPGGKKFTIAQVPVSGDDWLETVIGPGGKLYSEGCQARDGRRIGILSEVGSGLDAAAAWWPGETLQCGTGIRFDEKGNAYGQTTRGVVRADRLGGTLVVVPREELESAARFIAYEGHLTYFKILGARAEGPVLIGHTRFRSYSRLYLSTTDGGLVTILGRDARSSCDDAALLPDGNVLILRQEWEEPLERGVSYWAISLLGKNEKPPVTLVRASAHTELISMEVDYPDLYVVIDRSEVFQPHVMSGLLRYQLPASLGTAG